MTRQSVNDPNNPILTATTTVGVSDYQAVDDTPGFFSNILSLVAKLWWLAVIVLCLAAISFPYLFPEWADKNKNALVEMRIVGDSFKFIENAKSVDWGEALTKENIAGLYLVGTGRHPVFKNNPGLKAGAWFMGNDTLIMKEPVRTYAYLNFLTETTEYEAVGENISPMTDIEYDQAAAYCASIGGRLPTLKESVRAYKLAFTKVWQGKTGGFLKPNLVFKIAPGLSLWTSTPEDDSYTGRDNFAVFKPGENKIFYKDDGYNSESLGFLCARDVKKGNK